METTLIIVGVVVLLVLLAFFIVALISKFYRKVEQGKALIVNKLGIEPIVTFSGAQVWPIIHKAEVMDISVKTIEIDRKGQEGLICKDNIRADIKVSFFVRVNKTAEDVLKVAQSIGCARASEQSTLEELFAAKFSEALKTVGKRLDFEELYIERDRFKDQIIDVIGKDLNGYVLEDAAIDYLEQTSIDQLDPRNILDSQGIKKITEITTRQNILTNDLKQTERKEITQQNVKADEAVFELQRQRSDAEAKQRREIATVQAREAAETQRVAAEERARAEKARIKAEEEVAIEEENKQRQIEVAGKNRERVVGIESERVQKDRMLEAIVRERETELSRIEKEKALELERKAIADVVRDRITVEKSVAEEEERIKDLRAVAAATRQKDVVRITAEGIAQEKLVKDIKEAEAQEEVAKFDARKQLTLANAALESADKNAKAKIRLAEGTQAEEAAMGLAEAKVKEADAAATEKQGLAQVRVREADALAIEKQGLAQVRVKEADAEATKKQGLAKAEITREQLLAEAEGAQQKGLAEAKVKEADATATERFGVAEAVGIQKKAEAEAVGVERRGQAEAVGVLKRGEAEATAVREKLLAEAKGLAEKAEAMKLLDAVGRDHEEFRLRLQKEKEVELQTIAVRADVAKAQAEVLSGAFKNAELNIVGGDGEFFDRFVKAITFGHAVDGVVQKSDTISTLLRPYLEGTSSLPDDIKAILARPADAEDTQRTAVAALLEKLGAARDGAPPPLPPSVDGASQAPRKPK